ncbi:universal stress protein [soil metagenome]
MLQIKKVLYPTDLSMSAEAAFPHAALIARHFGAQLHAVYAQHDEDPEDLSKARLLPWSADSEVPLDITEVHLEASTPAEGILNYAAEEDIDLIVMGTQGKRGLRKLIMGSVAQRVVRGAKCPVLTVARDWSETESHDVKRLLVPIDFSVRSEGALKHAAALAEAYDAKVDIVHAIDVPSLPNPYHAGLVWTDPLPQIRVRTNEALRELASKHLSKDRIGEIVAEVGSAAGIILDAADRLKSDLILMSTHGLTGVKRFALGSVAERVVQNAACPVFTIKSFGKSLLDPVSSEEVNIKEEGMAVV